MLVPAAMASMEQVLNALAMITDNMHKMIEKDQNKNKSGGGWDAIDRYRNVRPFSGSSGEWDEFSQKFKSQMAAGWGDAVEMLQSVEEDISEAEAESEDWSHGSIHTEEMFGEVSKKVYNLLMNLTSGEANASVRRCRGNGLWAWKRISSALNPRTLASGVKILSLALNPNKINNTARAEAAIEDWEEKLTKMKIEYSEELNDKMKIAVLYSMLPKELQEEALDKCGVNWDQIDPDKAKDVYRQIKEVVKNISRSRREMHTPKPMEVDQIGRVTAEEWNNVWDYGAWEWGGEDLEEQENGNDEEDNININFVGNDSKGKGKGKCWTCNEFGHRSFECPKGGGKYGGKGKGKYGMWNGNGGDGKGGKGGNWYGEGGDYGKGGDGKGKGGWQSSGGPRACFHCGSTAHMVRHCPSRNEPQQVRENHPGGP